MTCKISWYVPEKYVKYIFWGCFSPVFGLPIHFLNYVFWWGLIFNFNEDYHISFPFFYIYSYLWCDKTIHDYTYVMNILRSVTVGKQNYWFLKKLTHLPWRNKLWMKIGVKVWVTQSCLTLCDLMECSLPGSSVHRILQAQILEWLAFFFSRGSSQPRDRTWVSCIADRFLFIWATREAQTLNISYQWWMVKSYS